MFRELCELSPKNYANIAQGKLSNYFKSYC